MKKGLPIVLFFFLNMTTVLAQGWLLDFDKAKEIASRESKPIILVFQGSDWCEPCIKLDREIWSSDTFKNYASENFVMLKADFPMKEQNAISEEQRAANIVLAEAYNKNGIFPLVIVLDSQGRVLGETGYKKTSPEEYINELNAIAK